MPTMDLYTVPSGVDLSKIPLRPNPDGSPPNFINPPSLASTTYGLVSLLVVLSGAVLSLRILSALKQYGRCRIDDCKR
jgi:hypothetical protein